MQAASTQTLYAYWSRLRGARSAPDRRDIDPTQIRTALGNTFILEQTIDNEFNFRLAGSHLCAAYARELKGRSFSRLWDARDRDAVDTLVRAVTEDHAVALISFEGMTAVGGKAGFEAILLPLRHNGTTQSRMLGAMTVLEEPYWFGMQPVLEQRVTGLRLIWPDELGSDDRPRELAAPVLDAFAFAERSGRLAMPATVSGKSARRYAHLAVIDGGRA